MAWLFTVSPAAPRLLAPRHELVEQRAQDALPPRERGAVRAPRSGPRPRRPASGPHEVQRIDLEGADQARVQALEVEHHDVRVEAGQRLEHVPAALRLHDRRTARDARAPRRRAGPAPTGTGSRRRRSSADTRSGGRPVSRLRSTASSTSRSRSRISSASRASVRLYSTKRGRSSSKSRRISLGPVRAPASGLALAQHRARDGVERVVVHADEGAAQELDAVEHDAAGHAGLARAARRPAGAQAQRRPGRGRAPAARAAASARRASTARSKSTTFQPVSTSGSSSRTRRANAGQQLPLGRERRARPPDSVQPVRRQQQHLGDAAAVERDRRAGAAPAGSVSMSSESTLSRGVQSRGRDLGVVEHERRRPAPARPSPRISSGAADRRGRSGSAWRSGRRPRGWRCRPRSGGRAAAARRTGVATSTRTTGRPVERRLVRRRLAAARRARGRAPRRPPRRRSAARGGGRARGTGGRPRAGRRGGRRAGRPRRDRSAGG